MRGLQLQGATLPRVIVETVVVRAALLETAFLETAFLETVLLRTVTRGTRPELPLIPYLGRRMAEAVGSRPLPRETGPEQRDPECHRPQGREAWLVLPWLVIRRPRQQ